MVRLPENFLRPLNLARNEALYSLPQFKRFPFSNRAFIFKYIFFVDPNKPRNLNINNPLFHGFYIEGYYDIFIIFK